MRGIWRAKRILNCVMPQVIILLYHRVADEQVDPQLLCVSRAHFNEHLQVLRRLCRPMSLASMSAKYRLGLVPNRSVVVTFDDGYADNLIDAKPILERNEVNASVFVTSGISESQSEYWWESLHRIFLDQGALPSELSMDVNGTLHQWCLGDVADYDATTAEKYANWSVMSSETPTMRHEMYRFFCGLLRGLSGEKQQEILGALQKELGLKAAGNSVRRILTPHEVVKLDQDGIVEVGAHTMSHAMLSALPADVQELEIRQSKLMLETWLGHNVNSFAYPYGEKTDYSSETVRIVRKVGFDYACGNYEGHIYPWTDRFQLPRFLVRNWDGDEFERRLVNCFK